MVSTGLAIAALAGRVGLLGYERIVAKRLSAGRTATGATFLFFAVGTAVWAPALLWSGLIPLDVLAWATLASLIYAGAFVLYIGALGRSDASLIGPLYHTSILVVIGLSWLVLDEGVTPLRALGGALLLYGASMLHREGSPWAIVASARKLWEDTGARMMLAGAVLLGGGRIVDKFVITRIASEVSLTALRPATAYGILETALIAGWLAIALLATGRLRPTIELARERPVPALVSGALNMTSYILLLVAFTGLDASIADPASSVSMVVTVLLAGLIFDEPWRERLPGALVMVVGAWLLFL